MSAQNPADKSVAAYLADQMDTYGEHMLQLNANAAEVSSNAPSLTNDVLPMFTNRWLHGPGQITPLHLRKLYPALRLASRWLSDEHCLSWFANLTYGTLQDHPDGIHTYLEPNALSSSPHVIPTTRAHLNKLGQCITFMWLPDNHNEPGLWGLSFPSRSEALELYTNEQAQQLSWPQAPEDNEDPPVVGIGMEFQEYLQKYHDTATPDQKYRALFLFAVTIVHEVTHAYFAWRDWLTEDPQGHEPLCSLIEERAEVGWSWENHMLGFAIQTHDAGPQSYARFGALFGSNAAEFTTLAQRQARLAHLKGPAYVDKEFTDVDVHGMAFQATPLPPDANQERHLYLLNGHEEEVKYSVGMYAIPMNWIVNWFSEEQWQHNMSQWRQQGSDLARISRPLFPGIQIDDKILLDRQSGDLSR